MPEENGKVRDIAVPGELLGSTKTFKPGQGTYVEGDKIYSKFVGILQKTGEYISVIPLSGVYVPQPRDNVIGIIEEVQKFGWIVNLNSAWDGFLSLSEGVDDYVDLRKVNMKKYFDVGDVIYTQVIEHNRGDIQLSMKNPVARKLKGGVLVKITPSKVPRLIGKQGSMVNLIKEKTKTTIRVGQNGLVWINGENIDKAIKAIKLIEEKSHIYGLTDEIAKLLG
ncbi:MAG: exosome complex RNA-binding protein Rrp4 [Candidatus Aenigmatarchaeota archaeon]